MAYGILIDIGGESELDADDAAVRELEPGRDSTSVWVIEYDPAEAVPDHGYHTVRVVTGEHWTGKKHLALTDGDRGTLDDLVELCRHWQVQSGVCDARGVGHAVAKALRRRVPAVDAYEASGVSVSEDCYDLLARLNAGTVTMWKADPAADEVLREMADQARWTRYAISGHELLKITKPTGVGSTDRHIDLVKALTYLHRAMSQPHSGLMQHLRQQIAARKEEQDDSGST